MISHYDFSGGVAAGASAGFTSAVAASAGTPSAFGATAGLLRRAAASAAARAAMNFSPVGSASSMSTISSKSISISLAV
jgi:hypothetical protein